MGASKSLGSYRDFDLLAGHDLRIEHSRCIIPGIAPAHRILYHGFPEIPVGIATAHAFVHRLGKISSCQMDVLSDLQEDTGHPGILANGDIFLVRDLKILDDIIQHTLGDLSVLTSTAALDGALYILRKMIVGFDTEPLDHICQDAYVDFTHEYHSFQHSFFIITQSYP